MPPKDLKQPFISINGERFERIEDCTERIEDCTERIESSNLDEYVLHKIEGDKEHEISFEVDKETARKFYSMACPKRGDKLLVEISCVCDSTLVFLIDLIRTLKAIGCTNIKWRSEEVENPNPAWMKTRFIATGIIWNTNNFRKLHGIPMKRRGK